MDGQSHRKMCRACFADLGEPESHYDNDKDGICDVCGWDHFDCKHPNAEQHCNDYGHWWYCPDCYNSAWGEHTGMDDGVCDVCGYTANAKHNIPAGSHECTDPGCGYITNCVDSDKDCMCDICGSEYHDDAICKDVDDNFHEYICVNCKKFLNNERHYDNDKDGKCDSCDHKMSDTTGGGTTSGKDSSLDNVPKTGDVMAPVAILSGLMSVAAVFTRKRFF